MTFERAAVVGVVAVVPCLAIAAVVTAAYVAVEGFRAAGRMIRGRS